MKKTINILAVLLWLAAPCIGAANYSTARLQAIATLLKLKNIENLHAGECYDYKYKSHPLVVRVNEWNEIEHIGFKLFDRQKTPKELNVVYDFLERYLLETVVAEGSEYAVRLKLDNVNFSDGTITEVLNAGTSCDFHCTVNEFDTFSVAWEKDGKRLLTVTFDTDYQLLTGCNAKQLEELFYKKLHRQKEEKEVTGFVEKFPEEGSSYIKSGDFFLINAIRNDLYFHRTQNKWVLATGGGNTSKSLSNTMLSATAEGEYEINITLDMYGYNEKTIKTTLKALQQLCTQEGCTNYFGVKEKNKDTYSGTLFMVNKNLGYTHMLDVEFPVDALKNKKGTIEGRLFVYIPLQNVTKKFFDQNSYKKYEKDED